MKIAQMVESKYLKKEDLEAPRLLTIVGFEKVNVAKENDAPDFQWLMKFQECKPLVVKSTNLQLAAQALGSDDTDNWIGNKIVAYHEPNVTFGGKLVGGIRLRGARVPGATAPAAVQAAPGEAEFSDDIPFAFAFLAPLAAIVVGLVRLTPMVA